MLLISSRIPTNDELNRNKIIRIFITDLNKNVYLINKQLETSLFAFGEESEERNIT